MIKDSILIRGLEVSAKHGVHQFEKTYPQKFIFDADIKLDFSEAAEKDDLSLTVSYSEICSFINEFTLSNTFNLIETLAYGCAQGVLDKFTSVKEISLTVYKPEAPVKQKFSTVGVGVSLSRQTAFLSLGSSLGDKKATLDGAVNSLSSTRGIKVKKVSSYIETEPVGGVAENKFLNCAVEIETYLSPRRLLKAVNKIEAEFLRVRDKRWGDRTLDIDIIFYGDEIIYEDDLVIPHPRYAEREFVLQPLFEIAPDFVCPDSKLRVKNCLCNLHKNF